MGRQKSAEAVVAGRTGGEGPNMSAGRRLAFDGDRRRRRRAEKPRARSEGSGRKPREQDMGASSATARPMPLQTGGETCG